MKNKIFLYSLTSLAVTASALAHAEEGVYVPTLEGGLTASVGTFLVTPTSDFTGYAQYNNGNNLVSIENVDPGYQFGIDASLGYIFEETANSVELFWRNISTSDTGSVTATRPASFPGEGEEGVFSDDIGYELDSFDLMFSQFVNLGEVMQLRLLGGLAYVDLENNETSVFYPSGKEDNDTFQSSSKFKGWGPRVGIDTRYGFSDNIDGLGIVGGGSMAYYLGDMDISSNSNKNSSENNPGNHAVLNFRANLGLDYVYFFDNDEGSTIGLELGYLIDFYDDGIATIGNQANVFAQVPKTEATNVAGGGLSTSSLSFAGPYLNLKGVF